MYGFFVFFSYFSVFSELSCSLSLRTKSRTYEILLVEDDANLREVTQRSLEKERYVVEIAADYRTALQKIEDYDYDCILLDIMLPDGSGLDLLEKLKEMHKRENVIILQPKTL